MKQKFSKLLPDAVAAIRQEFGIRNDDGSYVVTKEIPREYQGYISSFGASVMQMGLLPTLAVFGSQKEGGGSVEDRSRLLNVLRAVVTGKHSGLSDTYKQKLRVQLGKESHPLFTYAVQVSNDDDAQRALKSNLMDAAVATKLAIRTFKLSN